MSGKNSKSVGIVGAGIIGLYLAWRLSEAGYRVTVFEKKEKIWNKPCSGLISENIKKFIPLDEGLIDNKIGVSLIHFPKKTIELALKPVHYVLSHQKINLRLFELARASGARILFGREIDKIPSGFNRVVACDGALSKIRDKLRLPNPSFKLGIQTFFPIRDFSSQVEVWPVENGFFWKIPRGKEIEYGAIGPSVSIKGDFDDFLKKQNLQAREPIKLALVPQGLVLPKLGNVTLCGDAAGLTKPWSGGGVIWGLTAANVLIDSFPDFGKYHREARKFFGFRILEGKIITSLVNFFGYKLPCFLPAKITRDNDFPFI